LERFAPLSTAPCSLALERSALLRFIPDKSAPFSLALSVLVSRHPPLRPCELHPLQQPAAARWQLGQLDDCVSEDHFGIQNEQSASSPSEPTQQQLNKNFPRAINLLEQNRQPHVQRAALQLMCQPDSSKIRYVCQSVCAPGQQCKRNPGSCEFGTSTKVGTTKGKCGMQSSCCFKVIFSKERKNHGKQSGGDQFSLAHFCKKCPHTGQYLAKHTKDKLPWRLCD
jgi:ribosomal protein L32